jgi:hypothetical protein
VNHLDKPKEEVTMRTAMRTAILVATAATITTAAATSFADPYPDPRVTFIQEPMVRLDLGGTADPQVYDGHDEKSTAYLDSSGATPRFVGAFMADDFADRSNQPIVHVEWWGSYIGQIAGTSRQVKRFLIAFEKDKPVSATGSLFSRPDEVLSSQIVTLAPDPAMPPSAGTFTERAIRGPDPWLTESLYQYNAELAVPFDKAADTVYWMKIVALVDPNNPEEKGLVWGWHNRNYIVIDPLASTPPAVDPGEYVQGHVEDATGLRMLVWHFQGDSVAGRLSVSVLRSPDSDGVIKETLLVDQRENTFGPLQYVYPYDGPSPVMDLSSDLAFALYTAAPEPATGVLLFAGVGGLVLWRRR